MGLLGDLFWILTGGSYVAGGLAKDHVRSQDYQFSDIVHNFEWYQEHALELNHDRQDELFKLYKEDLPAFEALSGKKEANHKDNTYSMTGGRWGGYFDTAAPFIARREGWVYDHDYRFNKTWRDSPNSETTSTDLCRQLVKAKRKEYENSPEASQIPYIGDNNNWWIADTDTGFLATLRNCPSVSDDMTWKFGQVNTEYPAPYYIKPPMLQCIYIERAGDPDNPNNYGVYSAPAFFQRHGTWFVRADEKSKKVFNMAISVVDGAGRPKLMDDGYYWYNGKKTRLKVSSLWYAPNFIVSEVDNRTWAMKVCLELEEAPYSKYTAMGDSGTVGFFDLNTGIPVVKFHKLQFDSETKAELMALTEAVWAGWPQDVEEFKTYCERCGCLGGFSNFIRLRDEDELRKKYPYPTSDHVPYGECKDQRDGLVNTIIEHTGYVPYRYDYDEFKKKLKRRIKSHQNPAKLDEWSNLVFDLVNGEEHIEPEKYRELLEKFKGITGEDFTRGVDYLNMFRRLAIEDGWYIPEENNDWFLNPAPPVPVETYGCSELPTRYQ